MAKRTLKPGVYRITNLRNGKFYIGSSTINVHQRWNDHKSQLKKGIHPNIHLQRSYNKHGFEAFKMDVLEYCLNVLEREQFYIDELKPQYNIEHIAGNSCGVKRSKETCKKIGISKIGNTNRKGTIRTLDERTKISDTLKQGYKSGKIIHPMLGKNHTSDSIIKLKNSKIGNTIRKNNPTYTDFYKLDKNTGSIIAYFKTARECIDSCNITRKSGISAVLHACRNNTVAFGFKWTSSNVQVKSGELLGTP